MFYLFAASESNIRLHCCKWLHTGAHHCRWQHSGRVCPSKVVAVSAEDKNSAPSSSTAPPASPMSTRRPTTLKTVRCNQLHFLPVLKQKGLRKKTKLARSKFQSRCRVHLGTFTKKSVHECVWHQSTRKPKTSATVPGNVAARLPAWWHTWWQQPPQWSRPRPECLLLEPVQGSTQLAVHLLWALALTLPRASPQRLFGFLPEWWSDDDDEVKDDNGGT